MAPNAITLLSLLIGLIASVTAFAGETAEATVEASWLVVLGVLLDKLDGSVARLLRATSRIGVQLDSFADFVTFGIAPGAIVYARLKLDPAGAGDVWTGEVVQVVLVALVAAYVLSACVRLAKFNVLDDILPKDGPKVFYGLPTTFSGGVFVLIYIIGEKYELVGLIRWLPILGIGLAALMVSNWPLPKLALRKSNAINALQLVNIVLGYTCGVFRFWPEYLVGGVTIYAVFGFGWGLLHKSELKARRLDPYPS